MNRILHVLILSASSIYVCAQSYQKFLIEGAHWNMSETFCQGCDPTSNPFPYFTNNCCFKISGDTVVNGIAYKKLFESSTVVTHENSGQSGLVSGNWQEIELIREDTIARKVYFRRPTGAVYYPGPDHWCGENLSQDSLLYDFSIANGDSLRVHYRTENEVCTYDSFGLDSIVTQYLYGANRTVWFIHGGGQYFFGNFQLIEGIGYSYGLFGTPPVIGIDNYSYTTNLLNYCVGPDSVCGSCYTQSVDITTVSSGPKIVVYPNPAKDYIAISSDEIVNQIILTDIAGKIVLMQNLSATSIVIPLKNLMKGMYMPY